MGTCIVSPVVDSLVALYVESREYVAITLQKVQAHKEEVLIDFNSMNDKLLYDWFCIVDKHITATQSEQWRISQICKKETS